MEIRKATRKRSKLRIGFSAPSGGGKTFSALQLASGLTTMDRICVIDTEQGSSELYSHFGPYDVLQLDAPYSPDKYIEAIKMVEKTGKYDVLIIDSVSHEWDGEGGCLEMHERYGGRYQDWSKVTPKHRKFLQTILQCPMHVLTTTRRKQDYDMVKDGNRTKVTKVGLKEVQREGFEYELTINFDISQDHYATASKDRTKRPSELGLLVPTCVVCGTRGSLDAMEDLRSRRVMRQTASSTTTAI